MCLRPCITRAESEDSPFLIFGSSDPTRESFVMALTPSISLLGVSLPFQFAFSFTGKRHGYSGPYRLVPHLCQKEVPLPITDGKVLPGPPAHGPSGGSQLREALLCL